MDELNKWIMRRVATTGFMIAAALAGATYVTSCMQKQQPKEYVKPQTPFSSAVKEIRTYEESSVPGEAYRVVFANGACGSRPLSKYLDQEGRIYLDLEIAKLRDAIVGQETVDVKGVQDGPCVSIDSLVLRSEDITSHQ